MSFTYENYLIGHGQNGTLRGTLNNERAKIDFLAEKTKQEERRSEIRKA